MDASCFHVATALATVEVKPGGVGTRSCSLVFSPSPLATSLEIACKLIQIRALFSAQTSSLSVPQVGVRRGDGGAGASKCNSKRNDWNMGGVGAFGVNKQSVCVLEREQDIRGRGGRLKIAIRTHGPALRCSDVCRLCVPQISSSRETVVFPSLGSVCSFFHRWNGTVMMTVTPSGLQPAPLCPALPV